MSSEIALGLYAVIITIAFVIVVRKKKPKETKPSKVSKRYQTLIDGINRVEGVDQTVKEIIITRYIGQSIWLSKDAGDAKKKHFRSWTTGIALNAIVTLVTGLEVYFQEPFPWFRAGAIVLVVSTLHGVISLIAGMQGYQERWGASRKTSELLQSFVAMALIGEGDYKGIPPEERLLLLSNNAEQTIIANTEQQLLAVQQQQKDSQKRVDAQQQGREGSDSQRPDQQPYSQRGKGMNYADSRQTPVRPTESQYTGRDSYNPQPPAVRSPTFTQPNVNPLDRETNNV